MWLWLVLAASPALAQNFGQLMSSNIHSQIGGSVYAVDGNTLQLVDFRVKQPGLKVRLQQASEDGQSASDFDRLYIRRSQQGDEWLAPINLPSKLIPHRNVGLTIVLKFAQSFGRRLNTLLIKDESGQVLASVSLKSFRPPKGKVQVGGAFKNPAHIPYKVAGQKIYALSDRSFQIVGFEFDGRRPPDGWIYGGAGRGPTKSASQGIRLKMEGYDGGFGGDGKQRHCAMTSLVRARELIVTLPPGNNVCQLGYLGVYCYAYAEDFGHTQILPPRDCSVLPAYLPPVRSKAMALPSPNCLLKAKRDGQGAGAVDPWDYDGIIQ